MPHSSKATLLLVLPLTMAMQGCGIYRYHETLVTVTEAQTGDAIAGALLKTSYSADLPGIINMPRVDQAVTDEQGRALISIASWKQNMLNVDGYFFAVHASELTEVSKLEEYYFSTVRNKDRPGIKVTIAPYKEAK